MVVSLIKNYSVRFESNFWPLNYNKKPHNKAISIFLFSKLCPFLNSDNYQGGNVIHENLREICEIIPIYDKPGLNVIGLNAFPGELRRGD